MPWHNMKIIGKQRDNWATHFFSRYAASVFKLIIIFVLN